MSNIRRLLSLVVMLTFLSSALSYAAISETGDTDPYQYVSEMGYSISLSKTGLNNSTYCSLTSTPSYLAISIDYGGNSYTVSGDYTGHDLDALFVDLVAKFHWDRLAYGTHLLRNTIAYNLADYSLGCDLICDSQDQFLEAIIDELGVSPSSEVNQRESIPANTHPELYPEHIYAWAKNTTGNDFFSTISMDSDTCAVYFLYPESIICGAGGVGIDCAKFLHPTLGTWSDDELWIMYGSLVHYIAENSLMIYADACLLNPDIDSMRIAIGITSNGKAFLSFYDIISQTFSSQFIELDQ